MICFQAVAGAEVPGCCGIIAPFDICFERAERFDPRVGATTQLDHLGGQCFDVVNQWWQDPLRTVVRHGDIQLTDCCSETLHTTSAGSTFLDTPFQRTFSLPDRPAAPVTPAGGCPPTVNVALSPGLVAPEAQATVAVTISPSVAGVRVTLQVREGPNSGGHQHLGRPLGTFAAASGRTDASGRFQTTYAASRFGGAEIIEATAAGSSTSATLDVVVTGLSVLGPGANFDLVGATPTHPDNHYGMALANSRLPLIADDYAALYPGSRLRYNDQSLPRGGLFDIRAQWDRPHAEHRLGANCDVSKSNVPRERWPELVRLFTIHGSPRFADEPDHWHLRFE